MSLAIEEDLKTYCLTTAQKAKQASRQLGSLLTAQKDAWLLASADALEAATDEILAQNARDLSAAPEYGLSPAALDRLRLTPDRIAAIAHSLREIAALRDPIGQTLDGSVRPNGLEIRKVSVPLGTVFFIYESRPNVTVDAAAICVKSGNAVILRGGKEARYSSAAMVAVLARTAEECGIPPNAVQLVETIDRDAVGYFLSLSDLIDVAIPRGGKGLIERVVAEARMPVIKHYDGNCHVYLHESADEAMAVDIVVNSKCQRMGVCNACESLLVDRKVAKQLLPKVCQALTEQGIELRGDPETCQLVPAAKAASEDDWWAEYLGPTISIKVVDGIEQAIEHINHYGSHHTDAIVASTLAAAQAFTAAIDSSAVIVNASTRFNDGGAFGLGAEIGISTDKFHARGPCGLSELTTYKYLVHGNGQIRN
ncbi:glutamate-5-semialdehyde dehydrogenase [Aureliella helgolandensis]|uniref:Gamma-glutamyl phosphate reductase n=1 Tax=Aureliella helgolandensis TaxID=2527968 RepID=A0A518G375_9BACT|nr:glutamate-5-semialdehyde dehydrogenase [Aureliella helgolandensis]QDV23053.1 Gamma-glutamyl phosphate reductase [Aureliella helgolandensis]